MVQPDATKAATLMHVETYFQMNYETGDWKRIKKCRPLPALRTQSVGPPESDKQPPQQRQQQQQQQQPQQQAQQLASPMKSVASHGFTPVPRLVSPTAPMMYRAVSAPLITPNAALRPGMPTLSAAAVRPAAS